VAQQASEVMQDAHRRIAALQQQRQVVLGCAERRLQDLACRETELASSLGRDCSRDEWQQGQQQLLDDILAEQSGGAEGADSRLGVEGVQQQQRQPRPQLQLQQEHVDDLKAAVQLLLQRPLRKQAAKPSTAGSSSLSSAGADGKALRVVQ
jgi:hypothetical protein